jgi:hypothetical protein
LGLKRQRRQATFMSAELTLVFELSAFAVAATLAGYAILKLDVRPLLAGVILAGTAWMLAGLLAETDEAFTRLDVATLRLRLVDAASGESLSGAMVAVIAPDDTGELVAWRLPATRDEANDGMLVVSLFVQRELRGPLWRQARHPAECTSVVDEQIEIRVPGYRPWQGSLKRLLPARWPNSVDEPPTVIEMAVGR